MRQDINRYPLPLSRDADAPALFVTKSALTIATEQKPGLQTPIQSGREVFLSQVPEYVKLPCSSDSIDMPDAKLLRDMQLLLKSGTH